MIDQELDKMRMIMFPGVPEITGIYQGTDTFLANFCDRLINPLFFPLQLQQHKMLVRTTAYLRCCNYLTNCFFTKMPVTGFIIDRVARGDKRRTIIILASTWHAERLAFPSRWTLPLHFFSLWLWRSRNMKLLPIFDDFLATGLSCMDDMVGY